MAEELDYDGSRGLDVLDVGCGQGIDVYRYALSGSRVTGVDITPRHVQLARAHADAMGIEVKIVEGDAETLPFPSCSFDRVSSNGVLHHTPDMPAALREIARVLRPGGEARVIVYNRNSFHYWFSQVLYHSILRGGLVRERSMAGVLSRSVEFTRGGGRPLVRVYASDELERMLSAAGFDQTRSYARHFTLKDTPFTWPLAGISRLRSAALLDRIGRIGGWYIVGRGTRPPEPG
jgi:ubiquinone/menaquinone biosynthesis C-methylase UbiE